ncbi:MAG: hypothetical protein U1F83_11260 [Verrucomicrobiota bacterium]
MIETDIELLKGIANQLRIHSISSTTTAGSGHPTTCCSMADLMAALFFGHMRYDAKNPKFHNNDRFILSKGHAAPILYAAWAEAGLFSGGRTPEAAPRTVPDLEGHPTPRLSFADMATGSLGQGLGIGVGVALAGRLDKLDYNTYVMLGDGESAVQFGKPRRSRAFTKPELASRSLTAIASAKVRPQRSVITVALSQTL